MWQQAHYLTRQTHHRLHAAITCACARVPRASDGSALRVLRLADGWPVPTAGERLHGVMARLLEAVHPLMAGTEGEVNRPDPRLPTVSESVEQSDPADDFSVLDHFVLRGISRSAVAADRSCALLPSGVLLHDDPRCAGFRRDQTGPLRPPWPLATSGASTVAQDFALARNSTTRQRRFIRLASLAGAVFLAGAAGGIAGNIAPTLPRIECGSRAMLRRRRAE